MDLPEDLRVEICEVVVQNANDQHTDEYRAHLDSFWSISATFHAQMRCRSRPPTISAVENMINLNARGANFVGDQGPRPDFSLDLFVRYGWAQYYRLSEPSQRCSSRTSDLPEVRETRGGSISKIGLHSQYW
jgi:hypothetical protein